MIEAAAMIQGQITGYEVQLEVMSAYLSPEQSGSHACSFQH